MSEVKWNTNKNKSSNTATKIRRSTATDANVTHKSELKEILKVAKIVALDSIIDKKNQATDKYLL